MTSTKITTRKADPSDLALLVNIRLEVIRAAFGLKEVDDNIYAVEQETTQYYKKHLGSDQHITYLAYIDNHLAGCGSICFYSLMPTYHYLTQNCAYIMNMYTRPEFRRKGIAYLLLDLLVKEAREHKTSKLSLEASPMGRLLYEKYGFVPMMNEMLLPGDLLL